MYIELHTHSNFSLLDGASTTHDLMQRASELDMPALALTDHDAVYGAVAFSQVAHEYGIKPILGAELTLEDGYHLTVLAKNDVGWRNLCTLITLGRHNAPKGHALLPQSALFEYKEGLIVLSGCRQGEISQAILKRDYQTALASASMYIDVFSKDNFWIELQHHKHPEDKHLVADLVALADHLGVGYVATNNVHYATPDGHGLHDVLTCIRDKTNVYEHPRRRPNAEYYLKGYEAMCDLFAPYPQALANTMLIADHCTFQLHYGFQELPQFPTPHSIPIDAYLWQLCTDAMHRYGLNDDASFNQLHHELEVISNAGLSNYFLIVWDIVRFSRECGILCQGRGSAANSLVAYLLDISPINPMAHDLVFERFLSTERQSTPDIDIDFDAQRREEVIQYIYRRYGHDHVAMACTFVTFQARSALRDVGKALALPLDVVDQVARTIDTYKARDLSQSASLEDVLGDKLTTHSWEQLLELCEQIDGFPRHLGIHNGGMVVTGLPLNQRVPIEPATMRDRYVVQWDKESLEDIGLVKIDILGLRMLSAISETVEIIHQQTGTHPDLNRLTFDDPAIFQMISEADTIGVFQVESRAQAQVLPRLRPTCFNDLIVSISLIRPGPVQGEMVHPYLRRRAGIEPVTYFHDSLEPVLKETLGVILFQEQVLKVARELAGFTAGQGELLRRALGAKNAEDAIATFHDSFIDGAVNRGVDLEIADLVFDKLRAFGGYSFAKSHAAAFAVLVYWSAWLKHYHPIPFYVGLLNNQPMGFWSPAVLIGDAKRHGIGVYLVNVNQSVYKCRAENNGILLGFNYIKGIGERAGNQIAQARGKQPFKNLADFCKRTQLPHRLVEHLIQAGAMDDWNIPRRQLIWELGTLRYNTSELDFEQPPDRIDLPEPSEAELAEMEMGITGLSVGDHPIMFYRDRLFQKGILNSEQVNNFPTKCTVWVAGKQVVHQAPYTAKGFRFITLEDELGFINVVVRPAIYIQFRQIIRSNGLLLVQGQVQREGDVTNIVAFHVRAMIG